VVFFSVMLEAVVLVVWGEMGGRYDADDGAKG
jgi:hypothetical protein